jgi:hypothetical protein
MNAPRSRSLGFLLTPLAFLCSTSGPTAVAAGTPAPGGPGGGPVAGPVEVFVQAEVTSGPVGSLVETELVVANDGDDPVRVVLLGRFTWPDGSTGLLRYGTPVVVDAHGALIVNALSPIPADVGSGSGSFAVTAVVGAIGWGGRGGRADYPGALIARDADGFELP